MPFHRTNEAGRRPAMLAASAIALSVCFGAGAAEAQITTDIPVIDETLTQSQSEPEFVAGRILVKFREQAAAPEFSAAEAESLGLEVQPVGETSGGEIIYQLEQTELLRLNILSPQALDDRVDQIVRELNSREDVEYALKDAVAKPFLTPDDLGFAMQWHFSDYVAGAGGADLPKAWERTTGDANITVAVIDTGIVADHPDITAPPSGSSRGYDFISDAVRANDGDGRDGDPTDPGDACAQGGRNSWHGTHVAGTIGVGNTNNSVGLAGIDWPVRVISVRVLGRCGGAFSDITDGIRWAAGLEVGGQINPTPARVINMSLGAPIACSERPDMQNAINDAVAKGVLVVVAAGNSSADIDGYSPSGCNNVMAVAAADARGNLVARYSNFGNRVAIMAPGGDVQRDDNGDGKPDGDLSYGNPADPASGPYVYYNGTSMASPHVAGAAALLLAQDPGLSADDVRQLLIANARPRTATECPNPCGAGLLNADINTKKVNTSEHGSLLSEDDATADAGQVAFLGQQAETSVEPEALSGTGFTYRHDWGDKRGQWKLNLSWGSIQNNSRVFAAIGECRPGGGKFIGSARYTLHNVAPSNGAVSVWVDIQWNEPIRLCVDYLAVNP